MGFVRQFSRFVAGSWTLVTRGELPYWLWIVALVLHAFYRARIEAAARLEAAYQWRPYSKD